MDTKLSQEDIDRLFQEQADAPEAVSAASQDAAPYDFRRPDRIPKEQLRAIHLMHDFLARNLASSLGAYLRAYTTVSLVAVEQLSFGEFLQYLPTPTCLFGIGMRPTEGNAVLELNPSLAFPMLDVLLGGSGTASVHEAREVTEIELSILEGVARIVLHDLMDAWEPIAEIDFSIENMETQPQLIQILSPNEAIVAIGFEITMGENRGMMNFGVPSVLIKMMGQRFEQQWSIRRRADAQSDWLRIHRLAQQIPVRLDARLEGAKIGVKQLLDLEPGDVISLDLSLQQLVELQVNGHRKFLGEIVNTATKRGVEVKQNITQKSGSP